MKPVVWRTLGTTIAVAALGVAFVHAQPAFTKAQVGDRIRKVEDGVDEFRSTSSGGATRHTSGRTPRRRTPRQDSGKSGAEAAGDTATTQVRTDHAKHTKDELDDALGELNQSTNRLRRKFDPTPNYMETRVEVDRVMDDARKVNQVMTRGKYGTQPERLWGALRSSINDLGRCYGIAPMGL